MAFSGYISTGGNALFNIAHPVTSGGSQYTLPSGTKKMKIQLKPTTDYYFSITDGSANFKFFLCHDNSDKIEICTISVTAGSSQKSGGIPTTAVEKDLSSLAGKTLYARFEMVSTTKNYYPKLNNRYMPIEMQAPYTAVTQGSEIKKEAITQTGASVTAGTVMTNSKFSSGTKIEASTFNSQVLGL